MRLVLIIILFAGMACLLGGCSQSEVASDAQSQQPEQALSSADQQQITSLRKAFFSGPICDRDDLMPLLPSQMPKASGLGLQTHFNQASFKPWFNYDKLLPYAQALGVKWIRDAPAWGRIDENYDNTYEHPGVHDGWVHALSDRGFCLLALLLYGPADKLSPEQLSERYVKYASFVIDRYGSTIGAVQLWNEPNNFGGWKQHYGGKWYGGPWVKSFSEFLTMSAKAIKQRYPDLTVISGTGIEATTPQVLAEAGRYLDATYLHPYPRYQIPEFMPMVNGDANGTKPIYPSKMLFVDALDQWLTSLRQQAGNPNLGLWLTEYGSAVYRPDDGVKGDHLHHPPVDDATQAKVIARLMLMALESRDIERSFIFILMDDYKKPTRPGFGLMTADYTLRPSFNVYGRINAVTRGVVHATIDPANAVRSIKPVNADATGPLLPTINDVRLVSFTRDDGVKMLSISAPITKASDTSNSYQSVTATVQIDATMGDAPLLLNLMTGQSSVLPIVHAADGNTVNVTVMDYPTLIIANLTQRK